MCARALARCVCPHSSKNQSKKQLVIKHHEAKEMVARECPSVVKVLGWRAREHTRPGPPSLLEKRGKRAPPGCALRVRAVV